MSQRARLVDRFCSGVVVGGFAVIGLCLVAPDPGRIVWSDWSSHTIYPWWTIALAGAGLVAGFVALRAAPLATASTRLVAALPGLTGVLAAVLAGSGAVAIKHWKPASGMAGYAGDLDLLRRVALVIAVVGAAVALVSLLQLAMRGFTTRPSRSRPTWVALVAGTGLVLGLPLAIGAGSSEDRDLTSLGAYALIYAAPWGLSVLATTWLRVEAAVMVLAGCLLAAALAVVGPQMTALVLGGGSPGFVLAAAILLVTLLVRVMPEKTSPGLAGST